jgi:hypothetical protein
MVAGSKGFQQLSENILIFILKCSDLTPGTGNKVSNVHVQGVDAYFFDTSQGGTL